jgi:hypothetical protein
MVGLRAEKDALLYFRRTGARGRSWRVCSACTSGRARACARRRGGGGRGSDQEAVGAGGEGGWCARATRGRGAPLREQEKVLVTLRTRARLKANTIVGEATNQARASAELQEMRQHDTSSIHPDTDVPQVRGLAARRAELAALAS